MTGDGTRKLSYRITCPNAFAASGVTMEGWIVSFMISLTWEKKHSGCTKQQALYIHPRPTQSSAMTGINPQSGSWLACSSQDCTSRKPSIYPIQSLPTNCTNTTKQQSVYIYICRKLTTAVHKPSTSMHVSLPNPHAQTHIHTVWNFIIASTPPSSIAQL